MPKIKSQCQIPMVIRTLKTEFQLHPSSCIFKILHAFYFNDVYIHGRSCIHLFISIIQIKKITNFGFGIRLMSVWSFVIMNLTRLLNSIQSWDRILNRCIGDDVSTACPLEIASYTLDTLLINIDCDIVFHASLIL